MVQLTLEEIQQLIGAELIGNPSHSVKGAAGLEKAQDTHISFLANPRYRPLLKHSQAGAIIIGLTDEMEPGKNYLKVKNPTSAFQVVIETFYKTSLANKQSGIHPTAVIDKSVKLGADVFIGPHVVIEPGAFIGNNTRIDANVFIGAHVQVGQECHFYPNVVVREGCLIGSRVILQPGCVIGSCGYGYTTDKSGKHTKLNQIGIVEIHDDVEIGANSTIDRARFDKTIIGEGTKIDNLVQIAHNVEIGKHCLLISQVGIAGSSQLGNHVVLAGQVGVTGHVKLDDGVIVGACSGVSKSLSKGKYMGIPAEPATHYLKTLAILRQLTRAHKALKKFLHAAGLPEE
jgi:UDP-3-O-[3-hydroxymyristoyl] glucosamine N-acyltransferase